MFPRRKNNSFFRFLINHIHLWSGLLSSIILFVVCLTGTIYVFKAEIDRWIEPQKFSVEVNDSAERKSLEEQIEFTEQTMGLKASRISVYDNASKPLEIQLHKGKEDRRGLTHYVHPYQSEILGNAKGPASGFFFWTFRLHRWLLADTQVGRPIVGAATLIFVTLGISGFFLWIPKQWKKRKNYKQGLKIKTDANFKRFNLDLHKVLGFYALPFILIMSLTGLNWSFEWYRDGASKILGAQVFGERKPTDLTSNYEGNKMPISLTSVMAIADRELDYQGKTTISFPKRENGVYEIKKVNLSTFHKDGVDKLIVDQYSGNVLSKELFKDKTFGAKIAIQNHSLHMGDTFGITSKIFYFIACLIATSLPITGVLIWLNKLKKEYKRD